MTSDPDDKKPAARRATKWVLGTLGALALAGLGNGVWELLFRPGIGFLGALASGIADRMDTAVYENAALDPTAVSSLMVLLLVMGVMAGMATLSLFAAFFFPTIIKKISPPEPENYESEDAFNAACEEYDVARRKRHKLRRFWLVSCVFVTLFFSFYVFSIQNESIIVWRTFNQNLAICAPYMDDMQRKKIEASFRQMKRKVDFEAIKARLDEIAEENSVELGWF